ncbi:MAG TPA: zinc ribbon domain-containing protein [Terriglobales bacterium]|jgi:hypothetical protein|nr:zinc ribbon domain-containing protein [Terriglobales bacterium]
MFCESCGTALQSNQPFCSGCGKEIRPGIQIAYPRRGRVQEHVRLLGIFWLALGALNTVASLGMIFVGNFVFTHQIDSGHGEPVPRNMLHFILTVVGTVVLAKAALELLAGWGLLHREPWARMLSLVLAFFALFSIPFGTALGVYTLWVLLPSESDQEYRAGLKAA